MLDSLIMLTSLLIVIGLVLFISVNQSEAHVNKKFGNITLDVGWSTEPPLLGEINNLIVLVEDTGSGQPKAVLNALAETDAFVMYGTVSKKIDFIPSETTDGLFESEIIPTRIGSYSVLIKGKINEQPIDARFDIESVEGKEKISFPDKTSGPAESDVDPKLQSALSQFANHIDNINRKITDMQNTSSTVINEVESTKTSQEMLYLIGAVGIGSGVGGIVNAAYFVYYRTKVEDRK